MNTKPVTSLDWSWRKLICTTLKCISIKEKHIEVSGEERRERHVREPGRRIRVWNSVWEYESNRHRKGVGWGWAQLYLAGKEGMENGRERDEDIFISHCFFLEQRFILGWIGLGKGLREVWNAAKNPDSLQPHYHRRSRIGPAHQDCTSLILSQFAHGEIFFLSPTSPRPCPKHNIVYVVV